jgi:hypothetical protein
MAKFWMEDDSIMSDSKIMEAISKDIDITNTGEPRHVNYLLNDIEKLHTPAGDRNSNRVLNISPYDLLTHIQQTMSQRNVCIIELLTSKHMRCIPMNDTILRNIRRYAESSITDDFKKEYPRLDGENEECYINRLCHIMMHTQHPQKLHRIQCNECIQQWLNSREW